MPGPAPNPNARRRNTRPNITQLPASGYTGAIPDWPFLLADPAEKAAWLHLWRTPQAAAWAQMELARTVARYVRVLVVAEKRDAMASILAEARQLEDRLGLTPMSMLRLRWEVVTDQLSEVRAPKREERPRLRAVE